MGGCQLADKTEGVHVRAFGPEDSKTHIDDKSLVWNYANHCPAASELALLRRIAHHAGQSQDYRYVRSHRRRARRLNERSAGADVTRRPCALEVSAFAVLPRIICACGDQITMGAPSFLTVAFEFFGRNRASLA